MKILVVDDEKDVKLLFEQKFRKEIKAGQIVLDFAYSGQETVSYLRARPAEINLILSDINMPGMSGIELLQYVKKNVPDMKMVMISAYGDRDSYNTVRRFGAEDLVVKPIDFDELKIKLQTLSL
jgi:CheY-like chemotaxis protein